MKFIMLININTDRRKINLTATTYVPIKFVQKNSPSQAERKHTK